jgi:hypothetical protein
MVVLGELAPQVILYWAFTFLKTKSQSYLILAKISKMEYPEEW